MYDDESYHTRRRRVRIQLMKDFNYSSVVCDAYISISSQLRMEETGMECAIEKKFNYNFHQKTNINQAKPLVRFPTPSRTVLVG